MLGRRWRVISPADETAGSLKCTAAQLHISFDCQFVVCAAVALNCLSRWKPTLSTVCPLQIAAAAAAAYLFQAPSRAENYLFPSIDLNHARLSIMYNLSYNTPQDTTPSQLHFKLIQFFFLSLYKYGQCTILQRWAFVVSSRYALIFSGSCSENHTI